MQDLIANLISLGLAKAEVIVYLDIVQYPYANGSQITKRVDLPKPSVYLALDKLYQRGLIQLIPGKSKQYIAQDAKIALGTLRAEFNQTLDQALNSIERLQASQPQAEFLHIRGYANFVGQLTAMLKRSQHEIYIQTNADLNQFAPQLSQLAQNGARIIIHSYGQAHSYAFSCEEYHAAAEQSMEAFRLLVVSDYRECIMSCGAADSDYLAIYTRQPMQVSLIAENIHNAIYWLKLYREHPGFDFPCRLATLAEHDIQISAYQI